MSCIEFEVEFTPYLIYEEDYGINYTKLSKNELGNFILAHKQQKMEEISYSICNNFDLYDDFCTKICSCTVANYVFDQNNLKIKLTFRSKKPIVQSKLNNLIVMQNEIIENFKESFGDSDDTVTINNYDSDDSSNHSGLINNAIGLCGELGPDTWMEGDILIVESEEFDDNDYGFGISFLQMSEIKIIN